MLQIPLWKRLFIVALCILGIALALPNLAYQRVEAHNDAIDNIERVGFGAPEDVAAQAGWPDWMPSGLVNLGLDLRGGAHLLAEVQVEQVYKSRMDSLWPTMRDALAAERATLGSIRRVAGPGDELHIRIGTPEQMARAVEIAREFATVVPSIAGGSQRDLEVTAAGDVMQISLSDAEKTATDDRTIAQALEIVRRRVDEVGTREPTIQRQGEDRILIQVPGIGSAEELKALIGTTAKLTFNPVVARGVDADTSAGIGNIVLPSLDEAGVYYTLEAAPVVTGEDLTDARASFDQNGQPAVDFRFGPAGAKRFGAYTAENIGQPFAIVLDDQVISAPVIRDVIASGSGQISGSMDVAGADRLSVLLRAGALPAELTFLEERTVGPELGQDSIDAGKTAALVGFALVIGLMIASYGIFGLFASVALIINMAMIFGLLSLIGATLTLPGIAGIVLTIGMAVDANVLVFERIREELRRGFGPARAIDMGYRHAMSAIIDANVTTMIIAAILFWLGSGPVKGFAVTLAIGIITSVFTALWVTRLITVTWFERRRPKTLEI